MKDSLFEACPVWAEKLAAAHPDDLSLTELAALESHVKECPACAAIRFEYRLMDARIRDYPSVESLSGILPPPLRIEGPGQSHQ